MLGNMCLVVCVDHSHRMSWRPGLRVQAALAGRGPGTRPPGHLLQAQRGSRGKRPGGGRARAQARGRPGRGGGGFAGDPDPARASRRSHRRPCSIRECSDQRSSRGQGPPPLEWIPTLRGPAAHAVRGPASSLRPPPRGRRVSLSATAAGHPPFSAPSLWTHPAGAPRL